MNIEQIVKETISEFLGIRIEEIKLESKLTDDLGADSLDGVEITMALEEEFGIPISDKDSDKLESGTVNDIIDYIKKRLELGG